MNNFISMAILPDLEAQESIQPTIGRLQLWKPTPSSRCVNVSLNVTSRVATRFPAMCAKMRDAVVMQ
jgi:hypothetical protein